MENYQDLYESKCIFEEGKQVGVLYHYTPYAKALKILESNKLKSEVRKETSFTRDKNFHKVNKQIRGMDVRLKIDGDKLSNSYKISPFRDQAFSVLGDEAEERVDREITNVRKYITQIDIIDKKTFPNPSMKFFRTMKLNWDNEVVPSYDEYIKELGSYGIPVRAL